MHPDTTKICGHMQGYALAVLGRAAYDATFSEMMHPYAHPMALTLAAHGAELLVKARIAEQHPLLIFTHLPKASSTAGQLSIRELFAAGRTIAYADLPERLWATTGYRMSKPEEFLEFGKLRNQIMHFAVPNIDHSAVTLRFLFEVIELMANNFWGQSIVSHAEKYDDVIASDGYLQERLLKLRIGPTKIMKDLFANQPAESNPSRAGDAELEQELPSNRRSDVPESSDVES